MHKAEENMRSEEKLKDIYTYVYLYLFYTHRHYKEVIQFSKVRKNTQNVKKKLNLRPPMSIFPISICYEYK